MSDDGPSLPSRRLRPRMAPLDETRVEVREAAYPGEVLCRKCRHYALPEDSVGRAWVCWICDRRIVVDLVPPK